MKPKEKFTPFKKLILIGLLILTAWMIDSAVYDADLARCSDSGEYCHE